MICFFTRSFLLCYTGERFARQCAKGPVKTVFRLCYLNLSRVLADDPKIKVTLGMDFLGDLFQFFRNNDTGKGIKVTVAKDSG